MDSTADDEHSADSPTTSERPESADDDIPRLPQPPQQRRRGQGRRQWSKRRKITVALSVMMLVAGLALGADVAVLAHRPARVNVAMLSTSSAAAGETWLILGTDSRATVPGDQSRYGTTEEVEGTRADVIALVRPSQTGLTVINLPRDLTINSKGRTLDRLATTYVPGPQNTVNALCTGLGIPTTHLVTIDMAQFADIIDSLGGVEVDVPEPVRDAYTGLNLTSAGRHRLTGIDALALVRSRHPEILRDGSWVPMSEADGAQRRSESTVKVMQAVLSAVGQKSRNPLALRHIAHTVAGNITLDSGTGLSDLAALGRSASKARAAGDTTIIDLPTGPRDESIVVSPTQESRDLLARYGYSPKTCQPATS
ncbi:LytR family transcriptional regulator [Actinomyces viscosus]|uniref:Membrane-bound protein lytR n=1 Tax=Actinomyces viscosus TaxID=1656 RepID=A0A448PKB6_ACTVI|nr:LCP family protein [Actinomyces viscosus]TFH53216.1 LytR family transcriptional regulator [Actinomyces viscosus]VEI15635.1 Membrane-bound protein lytR [Actinomyces viscosus]